MRIFGVERSAEDPIVQQTALGPSPRPAPPRWRRSAGCHLALVLAVEEQVAAEQDVQDAPEGGGVVVAYLLQHLGCRVAGRAHVGGHLVVLDALQRGRRVVGGDLVQGDSSGQTSPNVSTDKFVQTLGQICFVPHEPI